MGRELPDLGRNGLPEILSRVNSSASRWRVWLVGFFRRNRVAGVLFEQGRDALLEQLEFAQHFVLPALDVSDRINRALLVRQCHGNGSCVQNLNPARTSTWTRSAVQQTDRRAAQRNVPVG
jgi:hypothetical protein